MNSEQEKELRSVIDARELRSQHIPRPMNRHEKQEEHLWTHHDNNHEGVFVGCADCEVIRGEISATGKLPSYVL